MKVSNTRTNVGSLLAGRGVTKAICNCSHIDTHKVALQDTETGAFLRSTPTGKVVAEDDGSLRDKFQENPNLFVLEQTITEFNDADMASSSNSEILYATTNRSGTKMLIGDSVHNSSDSSSNGLEYYERIGGVWTKIFQFPDVNRSTTIYRTNQELDFVFIKDDTNGLIYEREGSIWNLVKTIEYNQVNASSRDSIFVVKDSDNTLLEYYKKGNNWVSRTVLTRPEQSRIGNSVSPQGRSDLIFNDKLDDDEIEVFEKVDGVWSLKQAGIKPSDTDYSTLSNTYMCVDPQGIFFGLATVKTSPAGIAFFIYKFNGTSWVEIQKIEHPSANMGYAGGIYFVQDNLYIHGSPTEMYIFKYSLDSELFEFNNIVKVDSTFVSTAFVNSSGNTLTVGKINSKLEIYRKTEKVEYGNVQQDATDGATVTIRKSANVYIKNPSGTVASLTVTLPNTMFNGQKIQILCTESITALTFSPAVTGWTNGATLSANTPVDILHSYFYETDTTVLVKVN